MRRLPSLHTPTSRTTHPQHWHLPSLTLKGALVTCFLLPYLLLLTLFNAALFFSDSNKKMYLSVAALVLTADKPKKSDQL